MSVAPLEIEFRHAHFFCGLGGGARGFNRGRAQVGNLRARFRCIGGIDVDAASIVDFERLAGVPGTVMDLFSLEQYVAFHGRMPPAGWREATPEDIRRAFNYERPNLVFLSAPCKGFSGLLAEKQSKTDKYQALNGLTLRGMFLMLEAWKDDLPELIIFENVPRIATRGGYLLDQIEGLLRGYGFAVARTTHNCGEIGNLAQSRERFLLVARNTAKVPNFLYEPQKRPLRGVGEVLDRLPLPGDIAAGGAMHRVPALQWKTWVRLAFVEAGKDWRSLNDLQVEDGHLRDFAIAPVERWHNGALGVVDWQDPSGVVTANGRPASGGFSVADPRGELWASGQGGVNRWSEPAPTVTSARSPLQNRGAVADPRVDRRSGALGVVPYDEAAGTVAGESLPPNGKFAVADPRPVQANQSYGQYGVRGWEKPAGAVTGQHQPGGGPNAVADPRFRDRTPFNNVFRIVPADQAAPAVAGPGGPAGGLCVADPRGDENRHVSGKYRVTPYDGASNAVIAASTTGNGASAVADPRIPPKRDGTLGVLPFDAPAGAVTAQAEATTGRFSVADPRGVGAAADQHGKYPVTAYDGPSRAVIGGRDNGAFAVADPRTGDTDYVKTKYQVTPYDGSTRAVIGASTAGDGAYAVADPRPTHGPQAHTNKMKVVAYEGAAPVVTGSDRVGSGALSVADPRPNMDPNREHYRTQGHYGVLGWEQHTWSVTGYGQADNGRWSVADRRVDLLPGLAEQLVCIIIARDGTWHRPFTTLELAALQSLFDPDDLLELEDRRRFALHGQSDSAWRERIGNAVPSAAAEAIANVMGTTLLLAMTGETFSLSNDAIWVREMQIALSVDTSGQVAA